MALTYLDTQMIEQPAVLDQLSATNLQIGNITGSTSVIGDLTVYGVLTALSGFNVVIASTTSTSALSVSNIQASPALDVYQGPAFSTIAVFKNQTGNIARIIDTGLTVNGILSTNGTGNSNLWNLAYTLVQNNSGSWNYQATDIKALTGNWQSTYLNVSSLSSVWNDASTIVRSNSANWIFDGGNTKSGIITIGNNSGFGFGIKTNNLTRLNILSSGEVVTSALSATSLSANNLAINSNISFASTMVSIGSGASTNLTANTRGNVYIGNNAGSSQGAINGQKNVFIGENVARLHTQPQYNVIIGADAANTNSGNGARYTVAIGNEAGKLLTSGGSNTFIGKSAGSSVTTGSRNIAIGIDSTPTGAVENSIIIGNRFTSASVSNLLYLGNPDSGQGLSAVPGSTITSFTSALVVNLNGTIFRIPLY